MKKIIVTAFFLMLAISLAGCGGSDTADVSNVRIDYGASAVYSEEDMKAAIDVIMNKFLDFKGCELLSLSYTSDEACNNAKNIAWMNGLEEANDNKEVFTQCIAFDSSFRSPKNGGRIWAANTEYTWSWWLARSEGGEWKLMTWGY